ncbi:hypothetical protein GGF50DRAFT_119712 [Schizophyllum commune]
MDEGFLRELERDFSQMLLLGNVDKSGANGSTPPVGTMTSFAPVSQPPTAMADENPPDNYSSSAQRTPSAIVREWLPQMEDVANCLDRSQKKLARQDRATRKTLERKHKSSCALCEDGPPEGTPMFTCSLCKSIYYCSKQCQRSHWKGGHKEECSAFAHPPLAKTFDTSDRPDIPWPIDPIFATEHEGGVGVWVTTSQGTNPLLQTACEPPEGYNGDPQPIGPPSFMRWAGWDPDGLHKREWGLEIKKYLGSTLATLRVLVQNRRKDQRAIVVRGSEVNLAAFDHLKECILPEDLRDVLFQTIEEGKQIMNIAPWCDYNKRYTAAILEINGAVAPKGHFSATDDEYVFPERPTGKPWEHVIDWDLADVALGPGDFVVFGVQYRVGDGHVCTTYPDVMTRCGAVSVQCHLTDAKSTDPDWCGLAGRQALLYRNIFANWAQPPPKVITLSAYIDSDYVDEYYRPYIEGGPDAYYAQRIGKAAKTLNSRMVRTYPKQFKKMFLSLPPHVRPMLLDMYRKIGYDVFPLLSAA